MFDKGREKPFYKFLRVLIAVILIGGSIYFFVNMFNKRVEEEKSRKKSRETSVKTTFFNMSDFMKPGFFYENGDGIFDVDRHRKIITIEPHDDFFVSLSHQEFLKDRHIKNVKISFEYRYEKSSIKNPQKHGGAVVILVSGSGYRTVHSTWPLCKKFSQWTKCEMNIEEPGKLRAMIVRFGGTSHYKKLQFRKISLDMDVEKDFKVFEHDSEIKDEK